MMPQPRYCVWSMSDFEVDREHVPAFSAEPVKSRVAKKESAA